MIRISFSLRWKRGTENAARPVSLITAYATGPSGATNANLLNLWNEMNVKQG
jgi:hypothetical protein